MLKDNELLQYEMARANNNYEKWKEVVEENNKLRTEIFGLQNTLVITESMLDVLEDVKADRKALLDVLKLIANGSAADARSKAEAAVRQYS